MDAESPARQGSAARAVIGTATATGVILACGIVTGLIAARSLGPTGRGQLAAITVWASTLLYAGTFGLSEAVTYFAAAQPAQRVRVWTTSQVGAAVLGVGVTTVGWYVIPLLFSDSDDARFAGWIQWYLLLFAVPCLSSLCACAWLQGVGRLGAFNLSRATVHVANAVGFVILFLADDASVWNFALVMLIGNAVTWLLAGALGPWRLLRGQGPSRELARRMLHYGIRVQVGNWSGAANVRLDQLLLSLFAPAASLGVYVVAVTYTNVVLTLPGSASLVMLPEMVDEHRRGAGRACMARWYRRLLWTSALAAAVVAVSGMWLLPLLFGQAFGAAVPLLALLAPATVVLGMNRMLVTAFQSVDRPEIGSTAEVLGLVVTGVSLVALMPRYGMYGAAAASLLAYSISHAYLLRQALTLFEARASSLCVPTRADVEALLRAASVTRGLLRRVPSSPAGTSALP